MTVIKNRRGSLIIFSHVSRNLSRNKSVKLCDKMVGEVEIPSPPHLVKSRPHLQAASTRILIFYKPHIVLHESVFRTLETSESAHRNRSFLKRNHFKASFTRTSTFYNSASQKILKVSEATAERRSLEVDLFRLNGFESYYKFTRKKND